MAKLSNEEALAKAVVTADALAASGKLNPAQADRFIDYVIDETTLKSHVRTVRFRNESLDIDKIGVGNRVTVPKAEASDPGVRFGVSTSKISLTPKTVMTPFEIGDNFREINIEGDQVEDHMIRMFARQLANDLEDYCLNGNILGPANLQSLVRPGGSDTHYVKDGFLGLNNGWSELGESANVVDAGGQGIGLALFGQAVRSMPTKFRRNEAALRWLMPSNLGQLYQEKLSTRATALGDSAAGGGQGGHKPYGIQRVDVPLWQFEPQVVEHVVLPGTTPVQLKNTPITNVVVTPDTLAGVPTVPFLEGTDYSVNVTTGVITRIGGAIGDGDTVKVTYNSSPQMLLTHMSNLILGIGRDIRIEKDRDIFKSTTGYAITTKIATQIEEPEAVVKIKNIGLGI